MIWHPRVGQRVKIHYGKAALRSGARSHGKCGVVTVVAGGKGPLNAEVLLDPAEAGMRVCVSRGNLIAARD